MKLRIPLPTSSVFRAVMRPKFGEQLGAAREVHAGSGYWSQDSPVQVLGMPERPRAIAVRWPGGKTTTAAVPPTAREIVVDTAGALKVTQ